jgi:iron complex outermembrane recepter protein
VRRLLREGGAPYARLLDNELRVTQLGTFGALQLRPLAWLSLHGGVRVDSFTFDVTDRNRRSETRAGPREPVESYDAGGLAVQPRVSSRVSLVEGLDLLAAYGAGVRSSDAAALSDGEFAPFARVQAAETGLAWAAEGPFAHGLRLVGFLTHVDRDLVFDERQARNVLLGASVRHGALLVATASPHPAVELQGSVTWSEAHLSPEGAGPFALGEGPRLPYVPRWSGRVDAAVGGELPAWLGAVPGRMGVGATWVGARPLPNEQLGAPYLTVDAGARVRVGSVEAGLAVENLLDARYHQAEFAYASNFAGPDAAPSRLAALHFAAGAPRMVLATVALLLEPDGAVGGAGAGTGSGITEAP